MISGLRERLIQRLHSLQQELSELYSSEDEFQKSYAEAERQLKVSSLIGKVTRKFVPASLVGIGFGLGFASNIDPQIGMAITGISTFMLIVKIGLLKMCKDHAQDTSRILSDKDDEKRYRLFKEKDLKREINDLTAQIYRR